MTTRFFVALALAIFVPTATTAGTFDQFVLTDRTPDAPLANPLPSSYHPRYISGFGLDDAFTVVFEDRDASSRIEFVSTTSGPEGFPAAVTVTNITDTHFVIKDWPTPYPSTT